MKKLLLVMLFAVASLSAQVGKTNIAEKGAATVALELAKVSLELTEVETLQISVVMKDLLILQLSINNLNARFQTLTSRQSNMQAGLDRMVERLRIVHKAPADKFNFDADTLKFVPLPPKEADGK